MGLFTICFAWREGATCAEICDKFYPISIIEKESILRICQEERIDGITTIASDTATVTVNYVASRMGLISNPDNYSETCTNKFKMRQCFIGADIPSPKFALADSDKASDIEGFKFPLIVKPTDRSGSRGVEKVIDAGHLSDAVKRAQENSFEHKAIIEEFVSGREISVESISFEGRHHILQITDKVTTGEPYFVELEHHQPSSLDEKIQECVKKIVINALNALHIQYGASHSELKITDSNDIYVIEIGARMGGDFIGSHLVQLSTGYDFVRGVIEVALGSFTPPLISQNKCSGVFFLCKETEWLLPYIINSEDYSQVVKSEITDKELRDVSCSADRSGYLVYQSDEKWMLLRK